MKKFLLGSLFALGAAASLNAYAAPITYVASGTTSGGVAVSAAAMFDISGNELTITLTNTSPANDKKDVPGSTLTGIFWNFTRNPTLTPVSATVAPGAIVGADCSVASCAGVTNVGGEFGYEADQFVAISGADRGIASSGYLDTGLNHNAGNFNGANLDGPASIDGINFGIISAAPGFEPNNGLSKVPVIVDTVVFKLTGANGLSIDDISHVNFQYGTDFSELHLHGKVDNSGGGGNGQVPEPATVAMLGLGLLGLRFARKARKA
jgi:hypothetical protein